MRWWTGDDACTLPAMSEREYVLGTHDEEIARLGLQHRVWRSRVLPAWRRAGLAPGHTALDVGCGPGYASIDLAAIVGHRGRVVAVDQSRRFLDHLERRARESGYSAVETFERDLDADPLPDTAPDLVWCRWILAFVRDPRALLGRIARALVPGGVLVSHEYYDYGSWRLLPGCEPFDEFVARVIDSWRASNGEPNVGRSIPSWCHELGLEISAVRSHVTLSPPGDPMWEWCAAFLRSGLDRLVSIGQLTHARADDIHAAFDAAAREPVIRMCTPSVIEIIARKPSR